MHSTNTNSWNIAELQRSAPPRGFWQPRTVRAGDQPSLAPRGMLQLHYDAGACIRRCGLCWCKRAVLCGDHDSPDTLQIIRWLLTCCPSPTMSCCRSWWPHCPVLYWHTTSSVQEGCRSTYPVL